MKKNMLKVAFVTAVAMVAGINVFNAQKAEMMSDIAMENIEALASDSEGGGLPWRGFVYDNLRNCCQIIHHYDAICSGAFKACK